MMHLNIDWDEILVNNFLVDRVSDRSLFELRSQKKRKSFFGKMCHDYENMLINEYIVKIQNFHADIRRYSIKNILLKYGAKENCYIMSCDEEKVKIISIEKGIEICCSYSDSMPIFLICTEKLVFFHGHYDGMRTPDFILFRK
jgi:hypothetical protein